ncbi:PTS transporter subunit EIIC [Pasteurella skyensis]|uniref:PTS transporter subunit EIIC n=1 Tax=Phocoenobacter skyensis TaxID=97481 RepID=A0AAJ6NAX2_9PAST|nr:PTS transporter subunit EIIC [Pasteurella skyensis]MDP8161586.1 PTS transporter subunit EIIC [Pasteurella skyensis]MDP8170709.1 PTS transporter subunit EIIC [Pasteurella skyensis]MDP8173420.1 PTS transporter subunit EIIC [Pasteurella skyensis]MDP8174758.1 PTS transporter subunit EIIC [Pasteurella skyensis]MDP8175980.1 PTS transporter subunit EIIC [Pasteurella skyensis]
MFKQLQQIGKAFMLPIAILPAAGLLLGIGGALSNQATVQAYPVLNNDVLQSIFKVMSGAGGVVFSNLALLLCIGLGIGLAKRDKGVAALAAVVGYLIMTGTIAVLIPIFSPEVKGIDTGVIGALVMGLITVKLHNKYHNIQLPQILGFFGGSRFVPIVTAFVAIFVGFLFFLIWPTFQNWLLTTGKSIAAMGEIGTFFYGFLMRLSGAVGLHHMIYPLFWYTELGGTEIVNGETIIGAQKIFFAQLANPNHQGLFTEGTRFFAGRFDTMMFGLPASCLAMYHAIPKQKRGLIGGLFLGAALTSFITGITEPIEFMFLFVAPWLYVFHAFLDGVSFYIADFLNISIGNTFSGGFIDFFLFGILQGNAKTNWMTVVMVGVPWAALYYFSFLFLIRKFNVMTPGRGDDQEEIIEQKETSLTANAHKIIAALGQAENIENVDACITRLRVSVKDVKAVNKADLKSLGAIEVLEVGGGIQAIFGAKAVLYKSEVNQILGRED